MILLTMLTNQKLFIWLFDWRLQHRPPSLARTDLILFGGGRANVFFSLFVKSFYKSSVRQLEIPGI